MFCKSCGVEKRFFISEADFAASFVSASNSVVVDQGKKQISHVQQRTSATGEPCHQGMTPRVMEV